MISYYLIYTKKIDRYISQVEIKTSTELVICLINDKLNIWIFIKNNIFFLQTQGLYV